MFLWPRGGVEGAHPVPGSFWEELKAARAPDTHPRSPTHAQPGAPTRPCRLTALLGSLATRIPQISSAQHRWSRETPSPGLGSSSRRPVVEKNHAPTQLGGDRAHPQVFPVHLTWEQGDALSSEFLLPREAPGPSASPGVVGRTVWGFGGGCSTRGHTEGNPPGTAAAMSRLEFSTGRVMV